MPCGEEAWSNRLGCSAQKNKGVGGLLKFIGRAKESTAEYITKNPLLGRQHGAGRKKKNQGLTLENVHTARL